MAERRVANKPVSKETPSAKSGSTKVEGMENIEVIKKSPEERLDGIEKYIIAIDPIVRACVDIDNIKTQITLMNDEITRLSGLHVRTANFLDKKLAEIETNIVTLAQVTQNLKNDYKDLLSDTDLEESPASDELFEDEPETPQPDKS